MKCPNSECGAELPEGAKSCSECGWNTVLVRSEGDGKTQTSGMTSHKGAFHARRQVGDGESETRDTVSSFAAELGQGETVAGRFKVMEHLGKGGMGSVYRVADEELLGIVKALKVILPSRSQSDAALKRFYSEIGISQQLNHPNIVRVFDKGVDESRGIQFFTMEYLKGNTLREELGKRGRFPLAEVVELLVKLCDALDHAHQLTVHRDISPENVMLCGKHDVKLLDFGIAKAMGGATVTRDRKSMGKAYYMAPEQRKDAVRTDRRADIYSLGVMFYELLTGDIPFPGYEPASNVVPGTPEAVDRIISTCLKVKPRQRYESAAALKAAILALKQELLTPRFRIVSTPPGADIWIDRQAKGTTPEDIILKTGEYMVRLRLRGYRTWEQRVHFDGRGNTPLEVKLDPLPKEVPEPGLQIIRSFVAKRRGSWNHQQWHVLLTDVVKAPGCADLTEEIVEAAAEKARAAWENAERRRRKETEEAAKRERERVAAQKKAEVERRRREEEKRRRETQHAAWQARQYAEPGEWQRAHPIPRRRARLAALVGAGMVILALSISIWLLANQGKSAGNEEVDITHGTSRVPPVHPSEPEPSAPSSNRVVSPILNHEPPVEPPSSPTPRPSDSPRSAQVSVDDEPVNWTPPIAINGIEPREVEPPSSATIRLCYSPRSARVYVDDEPVNGPSPVTIDGIEPGTHIIRVESAEEVADPYKGKVRRYEPVSREVTVNAESTKELEIRLAEWEMSEKTRVKVADGHYEKRKVPVPAKYTTERVKQRTGRTRKNYWGATEYEYEWVDKKVKVPGTGGEKEENVWVEPEYKDVWHEGSYSR